MCIQHVDGIGIAAHLADGLLQNFELVFQRIELAGRKMSMSRGTFERNEVDLIGKTIGKQGKSPLPERIDRFLNRLNFSTSAQSLHR